MEKITPAQEKKSLLPACYEKKAVIENFEKLLQEMLA